MAGLVSGALVASGAVVTAPAADADIRITSQYSQLSQSAEQAAKQYNETVLGRVEAYEYLLQQTGFGPGWCIDLGLPSPSLNTRDFEVRKLDGMSGLVGFNGFNQSLGINRDVEIAAIALTKSMLQSYYASDAAATKKKNKALQALLSNHKTTLDQIRAQIVNGQAGSFQQVVTLKEFEAWTGFTIKRTINTGEYQPSYVLQKTVTFESIKASVKRGEYVTVLVPKTYNVFQNLQQQKTYQRIIMIAQPGLIGFKPEIRYVPGPTTTLTITERPSVTATKTVTLPGTTVTETEYVHNNKVVVEQVRPTVTKTQHVQPVGEKTVTVTHAPETVTSYAPVEVEEHVTTRKEAPVTVTETVTETPTVLLKVPGEATTTTVTKSVEATATNTDAATETTTVKNPVTVTETKTAAPETTTKTVTTTPTTTKVEHTTITNERVNEKITKITRRYSFFSSVVQFSSKNETKVIEPKGMTNWQIEFVDDSNGLVKVTKDSEKNVLIVTPVKEGEGDVRIVLTDGNGNRQELKIHVINFKQTNVTQKNVTVNNHFFNVAVAGLDQVVPVPSGWDYKVVEGEGSVKVTKQGDQLLVSALPGVVKATVKIEVVEKKDGQETGNKNVYQFNIDTTPNKYNPTRVIGNVSSYKLEVANIQGTPEVLVGQDLVGKLEKQGDNWVLTPAEGKTGRIVIRMVDDKGQQYTFTLDVRDGRNVLVDSKTEIISTGGSVEIQGQEGDRLTIVRGKELLDGTPANDGNSWKIEPKRDGLIVAQVHDKNGVLVAVYTIVVTPQGSLPATQYTTTEISNRQTVDLTKGLESNTFEIVEGADNVTVKDVEEDGVKKFRVMPNPDFVGTIKVQEKSQGGRVIIEYEIVVSQAKINVLERDMKDTQTFGISRSELQKYRVVSGAELLAEELKPEDASDKQVSFKPGAEGQVVIEAVNSRDLPVSRYIINVTPEKAPEVNVTIGDNSTLDLSSTNDSYTHEVKITEGADKASLDKVGDNQWRLKPNAGADGKVVVEFLDNTGRVRERYTVTIVPSGGSSNPTGEPTKHEYKITERGTFDVTIVNNNTYEVVEGKDNVEIRESQGRYTLVMKEGTEGKKVVVVERAPGGTIVSRHEITITAGSGVRKFVEERRTYEPRLTDEIKPGTSGNTFRVIRGTDILQEIPTKPGAFTIKPIAGKSGRITIEELDRDGNPVRIVEVDVPPTSEGSKITPPKTDVRPNPDGSITVIVPGGSTIIELCGPNGCRPVEPGKIEKNPDGSITIKPGEGGILPDDTNINIKIVQDGVVQPGDIKINITNDNSATAGSSDGKCIAALVGIASPLLLLIPLGILSQVRIPGLEGVHGKLNAAVREANDRIQRGLGIYDRDRAQQAAGIQGAFSVANPEMIGLAAGALGTITAGLLIVDAVLRACGQAENTSSYQLGKATDNEFLKNGSSQRDQAAPSSPAAPAKEESK